MFTLEEGNPWGNDIPGRAWRAVEWVVENSRDKRIKRIAALQKVLAVIWLVKMKLESYIYYYLFMYILKRFWCLVSKFCNVNDFPI